MEIKDCLKESIKYDFIHFDEHIDAFISLEKLSVFISSVEKYPFDWKWAIIALHDTLQGSMVCMLRGTSILEDVGVIYDSRDADKIKNISTIDNYVKCTVLSSMNLKLMNFLKLYNKAKTRLNIGSEYDESIKSLNDELRNNFIHFTPKGWTIGTTGLYIVFKDCICFLKILINNSTFLNHFSNEEKEKIFNYLEEISIVVS